MTRKVDSKGDPINRSRRASATADHRTDGDTHVDVNAATYLHPRAEVLSDAMLFFATHAGGFLKLRRDSTSDDVHLAFTWNLGKPVGTYVYVRIPYYRLAFGLEVLQTKVLEVESGERKGTPDKYKAGS